MNAEFRPKKAHFESKSQIFPNHIAFNENMSNACVRLILAFNAIFTCTKTWTVVQSDIQKRLGWGREMMQGAIKECVKHGYLKVMQGRHESKPEGSGVKKGSFARNIFEFDIEGKYLVENECEDSKCPHDEYRPLTGLPLTVKPAPVNPPLPCSIDIPSFKKEPTNAAEAAVLFVSLNLEEENTKRALLAPYSLPDSMLKVCLNFEIPHIVDSVAAYEQYVLAQNAKGVKIDKPSVVLKTAIVQQWKPNFTKADKEKEAEKLKADLEGLCKKKREIAEQMKTKYYQKLNKYYQQIGISIESHNISIRFNNRWQPIAYTDESFDDSLEAYECYIDKNCP